MMIRACSAALSSETGNKVDLSRRNSASTPLVEAKTFPGSPSKIVAGIFVPQMEHLV